MRSPTPSLRSELSNYQRELTTRRQSLPPNYTDLRDYDIAIGILDRWIKRTKNDGTDWVWTKLQAHLPAGFIITPIQLAEHVIEWRLAALRAAVIVHDGPGLVDKAKGRWKHLANKEDIDAAIDVGVPLARYIKQRPSVLGREAGADRTWFIGQWAGFFKTVCGKPLNDVVGVLTEIAFDTDQVSLDDVKNAQRTMARVTAKKR
jgi:hypothetical protein